MTKTLQEKIYAIRKRIKESKYRILDTDAIFDVLIGEKK